MSPDTSAGAGASVFEDLDPAAAPAPRRALRWEALFGLLLVLGLAGLALGQWADQQSRAGHYQAGLRAAAATDWDTAGAEFAAAGPYGAAPSRLADARVKIAARDAAYAQASEAAGRGDWLAVLRAVPRVQAIAPHYGATDALGRQALTAAGTAALTGAIAWRLAAQPPGLYRFGAGGWSLLPDAGPAGTVLARCPTGDVIYDVPARPGTGTPLLAPLGEASSRRPGTPEPRRELQRAAATGARQGRLVLDPDPAAFYTCTTGGLWTARQFSVPLPLPGDTGLAALTVHYQDFAQPGVVTPTLPGPDWYAVAVAAHAPVLLLADARAARGADPHMPIYVATPDGSGRRLLLDQPGLLLDTRLSADGRAALLTLDDAPGASPVATTTTWLVAVTGVAPPARLLTRRTSTLLPNTPRLPWEFLPDQTPWRGQVLLSWSEDATLVLRVIDPRAPGRPVVEARLPGSWDFIDTALVDPATGRLLVIGGANDAGTTAFGVAISPSGALHPFLLDAPSWSGLSIHAGQLVSLQMTSAGNGPWHLEVHSQPVAPPPPAAPSRAIYSATQQLALMPTVPLRLAPNWLVYVDTAGALHGRSYDGTLDVQLPWDASGFAAADLWTEP